MRDKLGELRAEITRVIQEQARKEPSRPAEYPQDLLGRVAAYVRAQIAQGRSMAQCAQELGLPKARLHYWVYDRSRRAREPAPRAVLRPVQVSSRGCRSTTECASAATCSARRCGGSYGS